MTPLHVQIDSSPYQALIGVGGIGSGRFFALKGNHTLGREESRGGRFLPDRDYCKLHIITHYVKTLLGPQFPTILIGKVGDDEAGRQLLSEMEATGLETRHVHISKDAQTLYSLCFIYPDGSGGNLTTEDSACAQVAPADVDQAQGAFIRFAGRGIALAVPEVPLSAREKLLCMGSDHGFLRVASFITEEMKPAMEAGLLSSVDLLAINVDEAAAATGLEADEASPESIASAVVERFSRINPTMSVTMTAGKKGSWSWDGANLTHLPSLPVAVANTSGAGDAFLAGVIAGLVAGLKLSHAQELGNLAAALSVTSPHTIHPGLDSTALRLFVDSASLTLSPAVLRVLGETQGIA